MSSLITQAILADKYGPRLSMEQVAEVLGIARNSIYNKVAAGTFEIPTYVDGNKRFADFRDVAAYLDDCRARASVQVRFPAAA